MHASHGRHMARCPSTFFSIEIDGSTIKLLSVGMKDSIRLRMEVIVVLAELGTKLIELLLERMRLLCVRTFTNNMVLLHNNRAYLYLSHLGKLRYFLGYTEISEISVPHVYSLQ